MSEFPGLRLGASRGRRHLHHRCHRSGPDHVWAAVKGAHQEGRPHLDAGRHVATLESGKWAGGVPVPFAGAVVVRNEALLEDRHLINVDPYGDAWIARILPDDPAAFTPVPRPRRPCAPGSGATMSSACAVPTDGSAPRLWTIGHGARPLEEFIDMLQSAGVQELVDVRRIPMSRHNPQYHIDRLRVALAAASIGYRHVEALGGLRRGRPDSPNGAWRNPSFRAYADYMQTAPFEDALVSLEPLARQRRTALMCAESLPWRCHRFLIADALSAQGFVVEHLLTPGHRQVHRLSSWARQRPEGGIWYPAADSSPPGETSHGSP